MSSIFWDDDFLQPKVKVKTLDTRRAKIIEEIINSESNYLTDLEVLQSVYVNPLSQSKIIDAVDHRVLFFNLSEVISISKHFLKYCQQNRGSISKAFVLSMGTMDSAYSEYCRKCSASLKRLQEMNSENKQFAEFLQLAREKLYGRTNSWDLPSLIIKPPENNVVQRILKYPLFLKDLLAETPSTDSEYENLQMTLESMESIAAKINEIQRRQEIIEMEKLKKKKSIAEKLVDKVNKELEYLILRHGFQKKIGRTAQQIRESIGLASAGLDPDYNAIESEFLRIELLFKEIVLEIHFYYKSFYGKQQDEILYQQDLQKKLDLLMKEYGIAEFQICEKPTKSNEWSNLDQRISNQIFKNLDKVVHVITQAKALIKKRETKQLDYNKYLEKQVKGTIIESSDSVLFKRSQVYLAINNQLKEDLPKLSNYINQYMNEFAIIWHGIQLELNRFWLKKLESYEFLDTRQAKNAKSLLESLTILSNVDELEQDFALLNSNLPQLPSIKKKGSLGNSKTIKSILDESTGDLQIQQLLKPIKSATFHTEAFQAICLYSYEKQYEDDLSIKESQIVVVESVNKHEQEGWWYGFVKGEPESKGFFPASYVERID